MRNQNTIQHQFTLSGKGLHTGLHINAVFKPAPADSGIRIARVDLDGTPTYQALADYVSETARGTVLSNGEWRVSTVEHVLSALYAMQIDNCLIEVDAPEVPILDGSALYIVRAIENAGIQPQDKICRQVRITEPVEFINERTGSILRLLPADRLTFEVVIDFRSEILSQQKAVLEDIADYPAMVAPARTFCFLREVGPLLKAGYIKGGDLQNAVVIYDQLMDEQQFAEFAHSLGISIDYNADQLGYLTPLHFDNEPALHKLLDLMGDLSLVGTRFVGKVTAYRPGHTSNTVFARMVKEKISQKSNQ